MCVKKVHYLLMGALIYVVLLQPWTQRSIELSDVSRFFLRIETKSTHSTKQGTPYFV